MIKANEFMPFLIGNAKLSQIKDYKHPHGQQKMLFLLHFEMQAEFFEDEFEAGIYGSVIRKIYEKQKAGFDGSGQIGEIKDLQELKLKFENQFSKKPNHKTLGKTFETVFRKYAHFSGFELIKFTKEFNCGKNNFPQEFNNEYLSVFYKNNQIPNDDIKNEVKKLITKTGRS